MTIITQVYSIRKRLRDDDLRKIHKIIEDEMKNRDANRETQKDRK